MNRVQNKNINLKRKQIQKKLENQLFNEIIVTFIFEYFHFWSSCLFRLQSHLANQFSAGL